MLYMTLEVQKYVKHKGKIFGGIYPLELYYHLSVL